MIGQSFSIIAVILVMAFMFLRSGRRAGALFALPLTSVSIAHLLGFALYKILEASAFSTTGLHIALDVAGMIIGCWFCWVLSRAITIKKLRYTYFICCAVFLLALTAAYTNYLL